MNTSRNNDIYLVLILGLSTLIIVLGAIAVGIFIFPRRQESGNSSEPLPTVSMLTQLISTSTPGEIPTLELITPDVVIEKLLTAYTQVPIESLHEVTPTSHNNAPELPTIDIQEIQSTPIALIGAVNHNYDWIPHTMDDNGVEMVLVPPGCFNMGSDFGNPNEAPEHLQCFDRPFWIDKYEVTNALFGSEGYFTGPNKPRVNVSWLDANLYCSSRDSRLPTEREWEYAASGPDSWVFPWGNSFHESKANFCDASCNIDSIRDTGRYDGTAFVADVGTYIAGVSWVGAYEMAGNVWEWTSTIFIESLGHYTYPYTDDGRENQNDLTSDRILRGGGWGNPLTSLSTKFRATHATDYSSYGLGFRCAKSFSDSDLTDIQLKKTIIETSKNFGPR